MGNQEKCIIISAGSMKRDITERLAFNDNDLVIACDGGYDSCIKYGIKPNIIIGDFDSIKSPLPDDTKRITLKCEKDDTDTVSAIKYAFENGYKNIVLTGALGGRLDHTLANLQALLCINSNGGRGKIIGDNEEITLICNESITLKCDKTKTLSIFTPDEKAQGVTISGAKYILDNYDMSNNFPIGVSNEFVESDVVISVTKGRLFIMLTDK